MRRNPHIVVLGSSIMARTITEEILATLATFPNSELADGSTLIVEIRDYEENALEERLSELKNSFEKPYFRLQSFSDYDETVPKKITGSFPTIYPIRTKVFLFRDAPCFLVNRNKGPPRPICPQQESEADIFIYSKNKRPYIRPIPIRATTI